MTDRYAGDNNTKLSPAEKLYLSEGKLVIPALNIYSLLTAQNTRSACRQVFGRSAGTIASGILANVVITPWNIPLLDGDGRQLELSDLLTPEGWTDKAYVLRATARVKKGIPQTKERPVINLPWRLDFVVRYRPNRACTVENLKTAFVEGGAIGLGTFRPFYGTFDITKWQKFE